MLFLYHGWWNPERDNLLGSDLSDRTAPTMTAIDGTGVAGSASGGRRDQAAPVGQDS